jgi:PAS domain S-box-containing protein
LIGQAVVAASPRFNRRQEGKVVVNRQEMPLSAVIANLGMHTDDAIVVTRAEPMSAPGPEIVFVNPAFERMTGYGAAEMIGATPHKLHGPDTDPEAQRRIGAALRAWRPVRQEVLNYRKDGRPFWVDLSIRPVADESGWFHYWVAIQRDVTEKHLQEERLRRALDAAETAGRAKMQFIATLNHEIRTPMNGIAGMAALMDAGHLSDDQRARLSVIRQCTRHLMDVVGAVLDFSKLEAGDGRLEPRAIDLRAVCEAVVELCRGQVGDKPVRVRLDWPSEERLQVAVDATKLRQILMNLLGNAAKFTDAGEVVLQVAAAPPAADGSRALRFSVIDDGPGVPADAAATIFEPFTQADQSETRRHGGAGLGLTICRRLARQMGGDVTLRHGDGPGACFDLRLTLQAAMGVAREVA